MRFELFDALCWAMRQSSGIRGEIPRPRGRVRRKPRSNWVAPTIVRINCQVGGSKERHLVPLANTTPRGGGQMPLPPEAAR